MPRFLECARSLALILASLLGPDAAGAECRPRSEGESILMPPANLELYHRKFDKLSDSEQWRVRIHGIRYAALHPLVWGGRRSEKTENRRIVPIKTFFLRSSEDESYRLRGLDLRFRFKAESDGGMLGTDSRDPVIEVGFGGAFQKGAPGDRPLIDQGYVLRLSAFPGIESGLYYRSQSKYALLVPAAAELARLEVGLDYKLALTVDREGASVLLNGRPLLSHRKPGMDRGLVSLLSSWHPITPRNLKVAGISEINGVREECLESGLIKLPTWNIVDAA